MRHDDLERALNEIMEEVGYERWAELDHESKRGNIVITDIALIDPEPVFLDEMGLVCATEPCKMRVTYVRRPKYCGFCGWKFEEPLDDFCGACGARLGVAGEWEKKER